ncbi:MAG TPA: hypothetical protein VLC09_06830 [Polyangiaceae bacterium]|nr:hypothetical protein [Polyangiaceae bacterium]
MVNGGAGVRGRVGGVLGVAVGLFALGCESQWESSRIEYCKELDLLQSDVRQRIGAIGAATAAIGQLSPESQRDACAITDRDLRVLGATLEGFSRAAHVLARGRAEGESVEDAGFVLTFGADAVQGYDRKLCDAGQYEAAAKSVATIGKAVDDALARGRDRCQAAAQPTK